MPRRLRVLVLIKGLDAGGAERLVVAMCAAGDRERFDYQVAFVMDRMDALVPELLAAGIRVHSLGGARELDPRWVPRLRSLLTREAIDVMHLHLPYTAGMARLVARTLMPRSRPRLVYTEHSQQRRLAWPTRLLTALTIGLDDRILAVSEATRDELPPRARRRCTVLTHGIDLAATVRDAAARRSTRASLDLAAHHLLVVTVANLRTQKAYPRLLAAAKLLIDEGLPVTFIAAGTGPLESELRSLHAQSQLGDRFRFVGFHADALSLTAVADVFVLASDYEGMPVAVMEALAVGTPVVATTVGDLPRLLTPGVDALLVPPGRTDLLAGALREVLTDQPLRERLGWAGMKASRQFDLFEAVHRIECVYRELADG